MVVFCVLIPQYTVFVALEVQPRQIMTLLQRLYSIILNPLYSITSRINERVRNIYISICCFCLTASFVVYFHSDFELRNERTMVHFVCSILLFALIIFSIRRPLKPVKWNKLIFYTFFAAGLGVFVISFLHPIGDGYRAGYLLVMLGFPCLYYVWNNRGDYNTLYIRISASTCLVAILYFIYYANLASQGELDFLDGRVCASFYDPNMFSMIGMVAVIAALYMILIKRDSVVWYAYTAVSMGVAISIVYLGGSRLSILVVAACLFSFAVFYIKTVIIPGGFRPAGIRIIKLAIVIASTVMFVFAGNFLLSMNNMIVVEKAMQAEIEATADAETADAETAAQAEQTEQAEPAASEVPDINQPVDADENQDVIDRIVSSSDLTTPDSFLSGRLTLWKNYGQFLNMTGNDFSKTDWAVMNANAPKAKHAHNNFFELGYRCGIPVACINILLELFAGIICLIWLFGRKYTDPYYLFCVMAMACYALESMFDIATIPFERPAPYFFYMAMIPVFVFRGGKQDQ